MTNLLWIVQRSKMELQSVRLEKVSTINEKNDVASHNNKYTARARTQHQRTMEIASSCVWKGSERHGCALKLLDSIYLDAWNNFIVQFMGTVGIFDNFHAQTNLCEFRGDLTLSEITLNGNTYSNFIVWHKHIQKTNWFRFIWTVYLCKPLHTLVLSFRISMPK